MRPSPLSVPSPIRSSDRPPDPSSISPWPVALGLTLIVLFLFGLVASGAVLPDAATGDEATGNSPEGPAVADAVVSGEGDAALLRGFSPGAAARQRRLEERLRSGISPQRIEEHLRWLSSRPHPPGSEGARLTAEYVRDRLAGYGWEAEIVERDAWLTLPVSVAVEMVEPRTEMIPTVEEKIEGDPYTEHVDDHPGWVGYSASGDVTGQVVYARYGSKDEFRELERRGIDVEGKIALIRYFGTAGTGRKVHNAQEAGASGVILYADPAEDGYPYGLVYPHGDWRPPGSIMRRSVEFTPFAGDPLTPGWPSTPGERRLSPEEVSLPRIPVVAVSYAGAERILREMAGPPAPVAWQGRLPLTYRLGPGPVALRVRAEMDNGVKPMRSVVARLSGAEDPDRWVVLGNHHDAWIYGAGDPSSGTAAVLEFARVLGEMAAEGLRPRRTLVIGVWDAEEMLLGGSTEWVEEHAETLLERGVACINMDSAIFNPDRPLRVAAHPTLHELFREVARDLIHPRTGRPLFDTWTAMQNATLRIPSVDGYGLFFDAEEDLPLEEPWIFEVPSDDAVPFDQYLALPASDMYYGGDYGMYHSIYENFHWMKTVVDPDFEHHALMSRLQAIVALRLANADVVPFDFATEARGWRRAYRDLADDAAIRGRAVPRLREALERIEEWETEAEALSRALESALASAPGEGAVEPGRTTADAADDPSGAPHPESAYRTDRLRAVDRRLQQMPRHFYRAEGGPGRPWNKNLFSGTAYDLDDASGGTLPGIRFALDTGDLEEARRQADLYLEALEERVASLRELREMLE